MKYISMPAYFHRIGAIEATAWEHLGRDGPPFYTITICHRHLPNEDRRLPEVDPYASGFTAAECHAAIQVLSDAYAWVMRQTTTTTTAGAT